MVKQSFSFVQGGSRDLWRPAHVFIVVPRGKSLFPCLFIATLMWNVMFIVAEFVEGVPLLAEVALSYGLLKAVLQLFGDALVDPVLELTVVVDFLAVKADLSLLDHFLFRGE